MGDRSIHERLSRLLSEGTFAGTGRDDSRKTMPDAGLAFLAPDAVAESCELAGFPEEAVPDLQSAADRIAADPDLMRLAWHCHYLLCHSKSYPRGDARSWPSLEDLLGEWAGAFYLLIALSGVPQARAFHQSRGIPEQVARDTYSDTSLWAEAYKERHGVWGVDTHVLPWLFNHLSGELYRLVRLQFMQRPFRQKLQVFRHRVTREVRVLAEEGVRYRGDGQLDGTGGVFDPETGWTSRLLMDQDRVTGTLIRPTGIALPGEVCLPLDAWERILAPGDPILEVHIPAGNRMDFGACGDSFCLAVDFFPRYFPDRPFKGFCCGSWLLNTQFQDMLPPDSNIVRFQKEFYLFPIFSSGRSGFERIFGRDIKGLSEAPRDTTLRRAVLDHLQAGGYLRGGGGLLFAEDLNWGAQVYQNREVISNE
jgi:hypothetical protein